MSNQYQQEMHISLHGCSPTPLASYLKALGILRLVAEQVDAKANGYWQDEHFVLVTELSQERLLNFFLYDYLPTPLLAPWNGGSGFYKKGNETAWKTLNKIRQVQGVRWNLIVRALQQMSEQVDQLGLLEKPEGKKKTELLARLRANLDDQFLSWLDASVVLTQDDPKYPPLLGTGGNDGRLDFTSNFLQRLLELFDVDYGMPCLETLHHLKSSLFAVSTPGLSEKAIGQFSPGNAGGPNSSNNFEGESQINAWDFVLMLEGSVLFATHITKKMQSDLRGAFSYPFTVRPSSSGTGAASMSDESSARAEIWMPLWHNPMGLYELRALLGEGRVTLNRNPAGNGLDFARAVAKLGVDRGISAFQRYTFIMRSGKAYLATPLSRIKVQRNPQADIIDQLDRSDWLRNLRNRSRGENAPAGLKMLARRLEDALFYLAQRYSTSKVQTVLRTLGAIQAYLSTTPSLMESIPPVPQLSKEWIKMGDDASHEYRLALALAGLYNKNMPMRAHLFPVDPRQTWKWNPKSRSVVWNRAKIDDNLYLILMRRLLESEKNELQDKPLSGLFPSDLASLAAFLEGLTNDRVIMELLKGLSLAEPPVEGLPAKETNKALNVPADFCTLKPIFTTNRQLRNLSLLSEHAHLPLPASLPRLLHAGRTDKALELGRRILWAAGFFLPWSGVDAGPKSGSRLLSALVVPLSVKDLRFLIRRTVIPKYSTSFSNSNQIDE